MSLDSSSLARDYFGAEPSAEQAAALLFRLHSAPVYFYRKGRGRYRPAPAETLQAALAAVERKRKQDELRQQYVDELKVGPRAAKLLPAGDCACLSSPTVIRSSSRRSSRRRTNRI